MLNRYFFKAFFFSIFILFFQCFVLSSIQPIHRFINVYVYFIPILLIPIRTPAYTVIGISCLLGFFVDIAYDSLGLFMMASLWIGYARNYLLRYFIPARKLKMIKNEPISPGVLSYFLFIVYIAILCAIHNLAVIIFEWIKITINYYLLIKWLLDTVYSAIACALISLLYYKIALRK